MHIKRFRLESYGPFADSGWIDLSPSLNIFVGENNAGKSAILRSFLETLPSVPHRSSTEWRTEYLRNPAQYVDIDFSGKELDYTLRKLQSSGTGWFIAIPDVRTAEAAKEYALARLDASSVDWSMKRFPGNDFAETTSSVSPATEAFTFSFQSGEWNVVGHGPQAKSNRLPTVLTHLWHDKVFVFQALRSSPGRMGYAAPSRLDSNAGTLAIQLNGLQGDSPELFDSLVSHLISIFPTVGNLSVSAADNFFEIRVWATREQRTRELSFSLDDSGTGLAQAIAILFVAMTFQNAVLVIDEISSYLHPAAAKALIRILQTNYPQHQYLISTHSPEVLSAGRDAKVFWVRKNGFDSLVQQVDLRDLKALREVTGPLGVSVTDVFAAEHIVWVDGETEEACFPMLLSSSPDHTRSVLFIALLHTGDFHDKKVKAEKVFQIYERLTSATAPVISKVAFNFDADDLDDAKKQDLNKRSGGRIHFLPRRNLECYLLQPASIARVIVAAVKEHQELSVADVETSVRAVLSEMAEDKRYGEPASPPSYTDAGWLARVDGARLIADLFNRVTRQTLEFRKTTHSVAIVRDLLEAEPAALGELTAYVVELVAIARQ